MYVLSLEKKSSSVIQVVCNCHHLGQFSKTCAQMTFLSRCILMIAQIARWRYLSFNKINKEKLNQLSLFPYRVYTINRPSDGLARYLLFAKEVYAPADFALGLCFSSDNGRWFLVSDCRCSLSKKTGFRRLEAVLHIYLQYRLYYKAIILRWIWVIKAWKFNLRYSCIPGLNDQTFVHFRRVRQFCAPPLLSRARSSLKFRTDWSIRTLETWPSKF